MTKVTNRQIIAALHKTSGILAQTAIYLSKTYGVKISRQDIWRRVQKSKELKEEQELAREAIKDGAESVVAQEIARGNWKVALQVLKTLGKDRGYAERQEVTGADGQPLPSLDPKLFEIEFVKSRFKGEKDATE